MVSDFVITANDGHQLDACRADPPGRPRGALVVIQEAFGVNGHIRNVCERFANDGYLTIAPALYDRQRKNATFGYGPDGLEAARALRAGLKWDDVLKDVAAAVKVAAGAGKVGIVGYCVGGSVAWIAAQHLEVSAAVSYYGRDIVAMLDRPPRCPTMIHFAEHDAHIPLSDVEAVRSAFPELPIYVWPGEHGFDCDARKSFEPTSAQHARARTLALFRKFVG
jgi:carboxymethylenebutenolidase